MKNKINQPDQTQDGWGASGAPALFTPLQPTQTTDWREPKFTDYQRYQSGDEEIIQLNESAFDDLIQSLLDQQEQRHQREILGALKTFNFLFPRTFIEMCEDGKAKLSRGVQEATHIRRTTREESQILDTFESLLDQISQSIKGKIV